MKHFPSIKKNEDFRKVYDTGNSRANHFLVMYIKENGRAADRIGISVSGKTGNSVVRHHLTRLLRESFRLNPSETGKGYDLVIVVRQAAVGISYREIEKAYLDLRRRHGI